VRRRRRVSPLSRAHYTPPHTRSHHMPIKELVAEARALTGKPATPNDKLLEQYLSDNEVTSMDDFQNLSDCSFTMLLQQPFATLVMADALRQLRRQRVRQSSPPSKRPRLEHAPSSLCSTSIEGHIGTVTMAHNEKRNALGARLCSDIERGLEECTVAGVRVVVLRALPGVTVWSAGHDIREFHRSNGSTAQSGSGAFNDPLSRNDPFVQLLQRIRDCPVPIIAAVEGGVWGGACDIVATCDIVVAVPESTFAITPAKMGLPYHASGMAHFLGVLPLHIIKWMFFSSSALTAEEAARFGFLTACVPAEQLTATVTEMALTIASRAPLVVSLLKKQLTALSQSSALSPDLFEELHELRKNAWLSEDMQEGVSAFFAKRVPHFQGK